MVPARLRIQQIKRLWNTEWFISSKCVFSRIQKNMKNVFQLNFLTDFFTDYSYIIVFKREYTSHLDDENMYCFISKPQIRFMRRVPLKHCSRINNFFISLDKPLCFWNIFIISSSAVGIMNLRVFSRMYFQAPRTLLSTIVAFLI